MELVTSMPYMKRLKEVLWKIENLSKPVKLAD
jgi:hypothetical protein